MVTFDIDAGETGKRLAAATGVLREGRSLFKLLAGTLEAETEANFAAQGRPVWAPLSAATKAERIKRNKGSSVLKILQDRGILAASISSDYGADFALIGAGGAAKDYAGIHQIGGTIERPETSIKTRLRTDAKGNLLRQGDTGRLKNLAVFATDRQKRVRESTSTVAAFKIEIPARPYLPFSGPPASPVLQPSTERLLLDVLTAALQKALN
jgi:phage virion morphogenesis protein